MSAEEKAVAVPPKFRRLPLYAAAIAYVLAAIALWWAYPRSPRLVIEAGPRALAGGFSPDGQWFMTMDLDSDGHGVEVPSTEPSFVRLWNVHTGEMGTAVERGKTPARNVGFTLDGRRLFVGNCYYDVASGKQLPGKRFAGSNPHRVDVESPDGLSIASFANDTIVADAQSGEVRFQIAGGVAAAFTADGKALAVAVDERAGPSGSKEGPARWSIKLLDPQSGNEIGSFRNQDRADDDLFVRRIAISPTGDKVAIAFERVTQVGLGTAYSSEIETWDVVSGKCERKLPFDSQAASAISELRYLADGSVILADSALYGEFGWDLTVPPPGSFMQIGDVPSYFVVAPTGRIAAMWDNKGRELLAWRLGAAAPESIMRRTYGSGISVNPLMFDPDGRLIVSVQHASSPSDFSHKVLHTLATVFPSLDPQSLRSATSEFDVLDPQSGRLLGQIPEPSGSTLASVAPDGQTLVTSEFALQFRGRFCLWNVPTSTPWPAILGWALVPTALVGLLVWACQLRRQRTALAG